MNSYFRYKTVEISFGSKTKGISLSAYSSFYSLKNQISYHFPEIKGNYKIYIPAHPKDIEVNEHNFFDFKNNFDINNKLKIIEIPNKELSKSSITQVRQVEGDKDRIPFDELNCRGKDKLNKYLNNNKGNEIKEKYENIEKEKYENMEKEYKILKEKCIKIENENNNLNDKLIKKEEEIKELTKKIMETEKENQELEKKLEDKNKLLNENNDNENPIIQKNQENNNELKEKIQNIENENKNLKEKINIIEKQKQELTEKFENEKIDLQNVENEKQESNEKIENEIKDLEAQLQNIKKENQELKIKLENNEKLKNNEKENNEIIENKIKIIEEEKDKEINELNKQIENLNQMINTMNENNKKKMQNLEIEKNNLENNINEEFKKGVETITSKLKNHIQTEISKFQNDLFLKTKDLNLKVLEEQKQNLIQKIENSHKRIKEKQEENEEINNKNLNSMKQNQQSKLIHEGYTCNLCKKTPIIGLRYKCNNCYDYNLCENCYNDILQNKKSHFNNNPNHKFIKIDKIIVKNNNERQRGVSAPKQVSSKTETFKINYDNIKETPKDDYTLFNNSSNNNSPRNNLFIDDMDSKMFFDELSKPFQFNDPTPRGNKNINYNNENEIENDDGLIYSYKTTDDKYMIEKKIPPGVGKTSIIIKIINDGENQYKKDITKFVSDNNSQLSCKPCIIPPLQKNQSNNCFFVFEGLNELVPDDYLIFLNFMVGNKKIGQQITIKLKIESDQISEKLKNFRKTYQLSKEDFSDKVLLSQLQKYNFDFNKTFDSLFK